MAYSPDGEWIAGGAADNANHKVYVWDIGNEGAFAAALDVDPCATSSKPHHPSNWLQYPSC